MAQAQHKVVQEIGDSAGLATLIGVMADVVPIVLGVAAIAWYVLRFVNWYRTNYLNKESWKGM